MQTEKGTVRCEHVVNAGGYHARQIGAWSGLELPITTMQHHYVITEDVGLFDSMTHEIPVVRDDPSMPRPPAPRMTAKALPDPVEPPPQPEADPAAGDSISSNDESGN